MEWIPCNEKMPSEDELVLVSGEYIEYPCVISKGEYVHYWYSKGIVNIAWMPLPKPYRKTEPTISILEQVEDEPQTEPLHTCSVNGRPYSECSSCEHFKCTADEPQERSE